MGKKIKYEVKDSGVHGLGVFAIKDIKKKKKIIEYKGNRITWDEAQERFIDKKGHSHTMYFGVDDTTVIDGNDHGNEAKYINHSCKPNCKAINDNGRIFIYSKKKIKKGDELFYDYQLELDAPITKSVLKKYACFCGHKKCRGSQLDAKLLSKKASEKK